MGQLRQQKNNSQRTDATMTYFLGAIDTSLSSWKS